MAAEKAKAINLYELEELATLLYNVSNGKQTANDVDSGMFMLKIIGYRKELPLDCLEGVNFRDRMAALEEMGIKVDDIDPAMPVDFVRNVQDRMGYYMPYDFAYKCGRDYWGPIPLTEFGRKMTPIIAKVMGLNLDWVMDNIINRKVDPGPQI